MISGDTEQALKRIHHSLQNDYNRERKKEAVNIEVTPPLSFPSKPLRKR